MVELGFICSKFLLTSSIQLCCLFPGLSLIYSYSFFTSTLREKRGEGGGGGGWGEMPVGKER